MQQSTLNRCKQVGGLAAACLFGGLAGCKKSEQADLPPPPAPERTNTISLQQHSLPPSHVYAGLPIVSNRTIIVITNTGYISGYNKERKNPDYVCYRLFPIGEPGFHARIDEKRYGFTLGGRKDLGVKSNPLELTGFDHGHLAPNYAIASRYGVEAQRETYRVWAVSPQLPELNRETIKYLEAYEADHVANRSTIWVYSGPVFDGKREFAKRRENGNSSRGQSKSAPKISLKKEGSTGVEVPDQFYRIWLRDEQGHVEAVAFLISEDVQGTTNFNQFRTSIRHIEALTGINFFWELPDEVEDRVEREKSAQPW